MPIKPHLSKSQYRNFMKCPARELAVQKGEYPKEPATLPMLIGSYVDKALTEGDDAAGQWLDALQDDERKLFLTSKGAKRADVIKADGLINRIRRDETAQDLFLGDQSGQVSLDCEIGGFPWKCRLDVCLPDNGLFVELKTTGRMSDEWIRYNERNVKVPWYHKYWLDMAVYWEACRQNYETPLDGYLVAGLIADSPAIRAVAFNNADKLEAYLANIRVNAMQIQAWKDGSEEAPACKSISCSYCNEKMPLDVQVAVAWF